MDQLEPGRIGQRSHVRMNLHAPRSQVDEMTSTTIWGVSGAASAPAGSIRTELTKRRFGYCDASSTCDTSPGHNTRSALPLPEI